MTAQEAFEAVAELHGINIEHPSNAAKQLAAEKGRPCPVYKYQNTNDLFALCQDIWQAAYAAGMERAAEICDGQISALHEICGSPAYGSECCADAIRAEIAKDAA